MSNQTPWFDGSVKPARDGWYERKYHRCGKVYPRFSMYANGYWYTVLGNGLLHMSVFQRELSWRGLKEPK